MANAAALRAEALRLRTLARGITDEEALAAIHHLVEELETRAREDDNGRADGLLKFQPPVAMALSTRLSLNSILKEGFVLKGKRP